MTLNLTACNVQSTSETIGKNLFTALKSFSDIKTIEDKLNSVNMFIANFDDRSAGLDFRNSISINGFKRGVKDWNKIEYVNYFHKEFKKNGKKYSSACLVVKLNGSGEYKTFAIYLLNIQVGREYKILRFNDNWSRNESVPTNTIMEQLDEIAKEWVN